MSDQRSNDPRLGPISRRDVLRLTGGAGAAAFLGGRAARRATAQDAAPGVIEIPTTGAALPTDDVTFRWVDSGDQKAVFMQEFFASYQEAHPNITTQYDPLPWNDIAQVVPLGVQNDNAHDVFQIPLGISGAQAVREGWVAPFDDVVPNFAAWKEAFPVGAFVEGVTVFGGRTYALPLTGNKRYISLLLYNADYMTEAGYDPATTPFTWDEFRAAAKKLTEQGNGRYFGLIIGGSQVNQWSDWVGNLARGAGAPTTPGGPGPSGYFNWQTGMADYTSPEWIAAIDLLLGLKADGSIFPGSLSMNAPQARASMPQGAAAMIIQGPWNIGVWQRENPDFNFGVAEQPRPNSGASAPLHYGPGGSNLYWMFAGSPNQAITGDMFAYMGSEAGQAAWGQLVGIGDPPIFPSALQAIELDPRAQKAVELAETMRLRPDPVVRNPEVSQVLLELQPLTPSFAETLQGIFADQIDDPAQAMQDLQDRTNAELDRAIKAAQDKGAQVSRDDWAFPNWDPTHDFTEADYAAPAP